MHLGYVYCFSDFDLGAKQALRGYTQSKEQNASMMSTSAINSYVKEKYALNNEVAAQVRHTGNVIWSTPFEAGTTPFNLSHYCNINGTCFNSTYSA